MASVRIPNNSAAVAPAPQQAAAPKFTPAPPRRPPAQPAPPSSFAPAQRQKPGAAQQQGEKAGDSGTTRGAGEAFGFAFSLGAMAQGQGGGREGADARADETGVSAAGDASLDLEALADELLPPGGDDGIFEVTLPNGQKLGVAVSLQGGQARFHLNPGDEKLGDRLRRRQMELQGHLERRMQRKVEVTVL